MRRKLAAVVCMAAVCILLIALYRRFGRDVQELPEHAFTARVFVLDTSVSVTVYDDDRGNLAGEVSECVLNAFRELEKDVISRYEPSSELAALNSGYKPKEAYPVSATLSDAISETLDVCRMTQGALDFTIAPLADCWGIEDATSADFAPPAREEIDAALSHVGYEHVKTGDGTITIDRPDMVIDLSASGKGYALDIAKGILDEMKPSACVVDCGSSTLFYGRKPDGSAFKIGLRNPEGGREDVLGYFTFAEGPVFCSTSGDYEKRITFEGKTYHHIMDRSTGAPVSGDLASVTVFAPTGILSDALSTACFVLGREKSMDILAAYGCEACFVEHDGTISMTDGLKDRFTKE